MSPLSAARHFGRTIRHVGSSSLLLAGALLLLSTESMAGSTAAVPQQGPTVPTGPIPLVFVRPSGVALGMTVKEVHDLNLAEVISQIGDGEPEYGQPAMKLLSRTDALFFDELLGGGGTGAPIRRRYQALEAYVEVSNPSLLNEAGEGLAGDVLTVDSPLVGLSVLFTPAASQPMGFGRMYDSEVSRESHLRKLSAPVDWSALITPVAEPGVLWSIPLEKLEALFAPSGYLGWSFRRPKTAAVSPEFQRLEWAFSTGLAGNLQVPFGGDLVGEPATARLAEVGVSAEQGPYAQIVIDYNFTMGHRSSDEVTPGEAPVGLELERLDLEVALSGTITLYWGLDVQRPLSALVEADESVTFMSRERSPSGVLGTETIRMEGRLLNSLAWKESPLAPLARPPVVVTGPSSGGDDR